MTRDQMVDIMVEADAEVSYGSLHNLYSHVLEKMEKNGMVPPTNSKQGTNSKIETKRWLRTNKFTWEIYDA